MGRIWKMKWREVKLRRPGASLSFLLHGGLRGGSCTDSRITQHPARTLDQDKFHPDPLLFMQNITCPIEVLKCEKTKLESTLILKSSLSSKVSPLRTRSFGGHPSPEFWLFLLPSDTCSEPLAAFYQHWSLLSVSSSVTAEGRLWSDSSLHVYLCVPSSRASRVFSSSWFPKAVWINLTEA